MPNSSHAGEFSRSRRLSWSFSPFLKCSLRSVVLAWAELFLLIVSGKKRNGILGIQGVFLRRVSVSLSTTYRTYRICREISLDQAMSASRTGLKGSMSRKQHLNEAQFPHKSCKFSAGKEAKRMKATLKCCRSMAVAINEAIESPRKRQPQIQSGYPMLYFLHGSMQSAAPW